MILDKEKLNAFLREQRTNKIVFTNGVFDILHTGHINMLNMAKSYGDILIVGINSDVSTKMIKGSKRPIISERERAIIVNNLKAVDIVVLFDELDPRKLISIIRPDVHIKGQDYSLGQIIERNVVEINGGRVVLVPVDENSSTKIINKIIKREDGYNGKDK